MNRMSSPNTVVKINAIEVPPDAGPELEKRFAHRAHAVDNQPGFLGFQLLRPIKGEVRWFSDRRAGIVFDKPIKFEELAEWIGKRLEVAALKANNKRRGV